MTTPPAAPTTPPAAPTTPPAAPTTPPAAPSTPPASSAPPGAPAGLPLPDLDTPRAQVLLAIADDALISGHRASHWTGVAPTLEEDLAFSTIAQDGITQADLWYGVLLGSDHPQRQAAVDALGLGRAPDGYRHANLCEHPPRDFAFTLARHWVLTHFAAVRLEVLRRSDDPEVAALATKLVHEHRYHHEHAEHWFTLLARGDDDTRERFRAALAAVLPETPGLTEAVAGEATASEEGLLPDGHAALWPRLLDRLAPPLTTVGYDELAPREDAAPDAALGGRLGRHGADFTGDVWPEMTALYREHPGARW
jgi:ring-1,2-phenylacetyl-CoA epoxidase subunit PaaC